MPLGWLIVRRYLYVPMMAIDGLIAYLLYSAYGTLKRSGASLTGIKQRQLRDMCSYDIDMRPSVTE